jgi:hypothetical protein
MDLKEQVKINYKFNFYNQYLFHQLYLIYLEAVFNVTAIISLGDRS